MIHLTKAYSMSGRMHGTYCNKQWLKTFDFIVTYLHAHKNQRVWLFQPQLSKLWRCAALKVKILPCQNKMSGVSYLWFIKRRCGFMVDKVSYWDWSDYRSWEKGLPQQRDCGYCDGHAVLLTANKPWVMPH